MRKEIQLWLAVIVATIALGAAAGTASARNFSFSSSTIRSTWRTVNFRIGGVGTVSCAMTIEGSLHSRTIAKVVGTLVGYVTRASIGTCTTGHATLLAETLPWHIRYDSFTGTLPNISHVEHGGIGAGIRVESEGFVCLISSTVTSPLKILYSINPTRRTLVRESAPCSFFQASVDAEEGTLTALNTTTGITVTLI